MIQNNMTILLQLHYIFVTKKWRSGDSIQSAALSLDRDSSKNIILKQCNNSQNCNMTVENIILLQYYKSYFLHKFPLQ